MKPRNALFCFLIIAMAADSIPGLAAQTDETIVRRYGLFIGSNNGGDERVRLRYATQDAMRISTIMTEIGGIDFTDRILLLNPIPREIENAFSEIGSSSKSPRAGPEESNSCSITPATPTNRDFFSEIRSSPTRSSATGYRRSALMSISPSSTPAPPGLSPA
jgi:hypothetical protein